MHGTGLFTAMAAMMNGGTIVTLEAASLDSHELWRTVERRGVQNIAIVGDAFAKPMLAALEENAGAYDLSSLVSMISSGVMWSMEVKQAMLEYMPQVMLADSFGSSEAVGFGSSITTKMRRSARPNSPPMISAKCLTKTTMKFRAAVKHPALSPLGACAAWLLQRRRKNRQNFQNHWWRALFNSGRLLPRRRRRHIDLARTRLGASTRRAKKYTRKKWKKLSNCMTAWKTRWLSVCRMKNGVKP